MNAAGFPEMSAAPAREMEMEADSSIWLECGQKEYSPLLFVI